MIEYDNEGNRIDAKLESVLYEERHQKLPMWVCENECNLSPHAATRSTVATYASVEQLSSIVPSRRCRHSKQRTPVFHVRASRSRCFSSQRRLQEQLRQLFYSGRHGRKRATRWSSGKDSVFRFAEETGAPAGGNDVPDPDAVSKRGQTLSERHDSGREMASSKKGLTPF